MATIKVTGSLVSFTLSLENDQYVKVYEDLFSLRFNIRVRSMYVEQEMYSMNGDILETTLILKNMCENGYVWILRLRSFRTIRLPDLLMQASIVLLTNEFGASTVNVPSMATGKIEYKEDDVLVLLDSNEHVCQVVDFFDT